MSISLTWRRLELTFISRCWFPNCGLPVRLHEVLLDPEHFMALHLLLVSLGPSSLCRLVLQANTLTAALLRLPLVAVVLLYQPVRIDLLNRSLTPRLLLPLRML